MTLAPVTAIIPTYNSASTLAEAIDSALNQTRPPAQLIVVDDGSTDQTPDLLRQYGSRIEVLRQANQGVSVARNAGIARATQPLIALLDADDVWHPRKIELQMQLFERHPELGLVGSVAFLWPAKSFPDVPDTIDGVTRFLGREDFIVKNRIGAATAVFRRDILTKSGYFEPSMHGIEDRDLWVRIAVHAPVARLDLPLAGRREVAGSMSKIPTMCEPAAQKLQRKLEACGAFKGHPLLWCKMHSYMNHTYACVWSDAGFNARAVVRSIRSLLWYPLPYARWDVDIRFERPRRLLANLLRALRIKRADQPTAHPDGNNAAPPAIANAGVHGHD